MNKHVKEWFDARVDSFEVKYAREDGHFTQRLRNVHMIVDELEESSFILDAGCGTGEIVNSLAKRFGCKALGIDFSENMISFCKNKYKLNGLNFRLGDIHSIDIPSESVDIAITMSVFEWLNDIKKPMSEIRKVLKPRGQWIVSIPNWSSPFRKLEHVYALIRGSNYLSLHGNRISVKRFLRVAESEGFELINSLYHVLPYYYQNLPNTIGKVLGMMCILSMRKINS